MKCRYDKKGKDKCVTGKEADCSICVGSLKIPLKKKSSKSKSSDKFDDSLLDEPTPSKSTPDTSLQDLIKTMSSQVASRISQFEEFKQKDKPSSSQRDPSFPQEQDMCAPASQTRLDASKGELSDDSNLPQGEADSHQLGPKDLANLRLGHFDRHRYLIQTFCRKWKTT